MPLPRDALIGGLFAAAQSTQSINCDSVLTSLPLSAQYTPLANT